MSDPLLNIDSALSDVFGSILLNLGGFEDREIVLAQGIQAHDEDIIDEVNRIRGRGFTIDDFRPFEYLQSKLGTDFNRISDTEADFTNLTQKVHYHIRKVNTKQALKTALETPNLHVIYDGHSRFGRGTAFDPYTGLAPGTGEQWEDGTSDDNGIFRLGFPFVPVAFSDFETPLAVDDGSNGHRHGPYNFRPLRVEDPVPAMADRHPDARRGLQRIRVSDEIEQSIQSDFKSPSQQYWGLDISRERHLLFFADWQFSHADPLDLGATDIQCKTFCHFGCSSRLHYRPIIRGEDFKAWIRPTPPDDRYAYFTTSPSDLLVAPIWLHKVLSYNRENNFQRWFESLEDSKRRANIELARQRAGYQVF